MLVCMFVTVTGMFVVGELVESQNDVYVVDEPLMVGYVRQEPDNIVLVPYPPYAKSNRTIKFFRHGLLCEPYPVTDELKQIYLEMTQKESQNVQQ